MKELLQLIIDHHAKVTFAAIKPQSIIINVVCEGCLEQQIIPRSTVEHMTEEASNSIIRDLIKKCRDRAFHTEQPGRDNEA